jgi:uncharacterized protein (TIGR03000 family)
MYTDTVMPSYDYGQPVQSGACLSAYPSDNAAPASVTDRNSALIAVRVPANAEIWFDGEKTSQTGSEREFVSPPLTPGRTFSYDVRARWRDNGRTVDRTRHVDVRAGQRQKVDFFSADRPDREMTPPAPRGDRSAPPRARENRDSPPSRPSSKTPSNSNNNDGRNPVP